VAEQVPMFPFPLALTVKGLLKLECLITDVFANGAFNDSDSRGVASLDKIASGHLHRIQTEIQVSHLHYGLHYTGNGHYADTVASVCR
jgi:hypothetical protein